MAALVFALGFAACGGDDDDVAADELTEIKVQFSWIEEARFAPFYVAEEQGYYEEENLDVELIGGSSSPDALKFLGTEAVDVATADTLVAAEARAVGVPIVSVGMFNQTMPQSVLSLASDPIETPDDLIGRTIGVSAGSAADLALRAMLEQQDIDVRDITFVDIGFGVEAILAGQVDGRADFANSGNFQELEAAAGEDAYQFSMSDHGIEGYGVSIFANERFAEEHPEALRGFVRAVQRAIEDTIDDPDGAVAAVLAATDELEEDLERAKLEDTIPLFSSDETEEHGFLYQSAEGWETSIDTAVQFGYVEDPEEAPTVEEMFTNEFLDG